MELFKIIREREISRGEELVVLYKSGVKFGKLVEDLLYDRDYCKNKGINYCDIKTDDVKKIRQYVNWVLVNAGIEKIE